MGNTEFSTLPWILWTRIFFPKLDVVFDSLKYAAKLILAFGFVITNVEDESCRYYFEHEKTKVLERSKLVATTEDLSKIKNLLSNTDFIESCTRQRADRKWRFYKLTKLKAKLKEFNVGCKDTVVPDPILKNHSVKSLIYEEDTRKPYNDNICFLRGLALHSFEIERLQEETSKLLGIFMEETCRIENANFRGVCMDDIAAVEDSVQADIFLYVIHVVDGSMVGELEKRSVGKNFKAVRLLRYNTRICHVSNINALFKAYFCPSCDHFLIKLVIWSNIWLLAKKEFFTFFQKTCSSCAKHCFTNQTCSKWIAPITKISSRIWQYSILTEIVCRKTNFTITILQLRLASTFQHLYQFRPIFYVIQITELRLSQLLMLSMGRQHKAKRKWN